MAPHYKLTYHEFKGLGEPIRYLFALAGVHYEDHRVTPAEWQSIKDTTPFGQVPVLEIDGRVYAQCRPICRYLGAQFGYWPRSDEDRLRADVVADAIDDVRVLLPPIAQARLTGDINTKETLLRRLERDQLPVMMSGVERYLTSDTHVVGGQLTWADVFVTGVLELVCRAGDLLGFDPRMEDYPKLSGIMKTVLAQPAIAAYVAARAPTPPDMLCAVQPPRK